MICKKVMAILLLGSCLLLSGCREIQIFRTEEDPNKQMEVSDTQLEADTYYVKNGTKFIKTHLPQGSAAQHNNNMVDKSRIFYFLDAVGSEALVPQHYRGEIIAYASPEIDLSEIRLERFKDLGYSLGIYGGQLRNDGYYHLQLNQDPSLPGSSFYDLLTATDSDSIRIKSIDGKKITEDMLDSKSGIFTGLERGKSYLVAFFSGTYYYEEEVVADTHFLQSYEIYSYGSEYMIDTTNGYRSFETPEDLKSGWYCVNGSGLFQYYDFLKGEKDISSVSMNENYYATEEEMIAACSSEYIFEVKERSKNLEIKIEEGGDVTYKDITAYVYAPDQTRFQMEYDEEEQAIKAMVAEAIPGQWRINVLPKETLLGNIQVNTREDIDELTLNENPMVIEEAQENMAVCLDYQGVGTVNGSIITPSGETYVMEVMDTFKSENAVTYTKLQYVFPYMEPGTYYVRAYHNIADTKIGPPYLEQNGGNNKDIIVIID